MSLSNKTFLGEVIASTIYLDEKDIRKGAELIGDKNPIHYSYDAAVKAGFKSIIASGGYTSSLFVATLTQYFEKSGPLMGLENQFCFKKPVLANQLLSVKWVTEIITPKQRLKGDIVTFKGVVINENNDVILTGIAKVLFLAE